HRPGPMGAAHEPAAHELIALAQLCGARSGRRQDPARGVAAMTAPTDPDAAAQTDAPRRLRASDAQREAVVHQLHEAVGRGLLSVEEGHERTATAYAARYVDELGPLTHDLPDPAPVAPGWKAVASTAALQARTSL